MAVDSADVAVSANVIAAITFTATPVGGATNWQLNPMSVASGVTILKPAINFGVTSNTPWNVGVKTVTPVSGRMTDNLNNAVLLTNPLQIETKIGDSYQDVTSTVDILNDIAKPAGATYSRGIKQTLVSTDARLDDGGLYSITLVLDCMPNL
jgi:hypothetical protein